MLTGPPPKFHGTRDILHDCRPQCKYHGGGQQALKALYLHAFAAQDILQGLYRSDHRERRHDQDIGGDQRPPPGRRTS